MLFVKKNNDLNLFDEMANMLSDTFAAKEDLMKTDIVEEEGQYQIKIDIPGVDKKDININAQDGYLSISVNQEDTKNDSNSKYIRRERQYKSMTRSFYVGDVLEDKIKAKVENGILYISVPKLAEPINHKKFIEIE